MTVEEICLEAARLSEVERERLICSLLQTMEPGAAALSDDEANRRWSELESGEVAEMSHEEFLSGIRLHGS